MEYGLLDNIKKNLNLVKLNEIIDYFLTLPFSGNKNIYDFFCSTGNKLNIGELNPPCKKC